MRWTDWFQLTKAKCGLLGLGNTTFSDCTKRLIDQGRIRKSQVAKNIFYQPIFVLGSSGVKASSTRSLAGEASSRSEPSSRSENGGGDHGSVAPAPDKAAQALAFLLKKPLNVI
jgi:hypothetical protein